MTDGITPEGLSFLTGDPKKEAINLVAGKVASTFGLKAAVVSFAITTAIGIGTTIWQNVTRFDDGWDAAIVELREGNLKLDDVVVEIKTEADKKAIEAWQGVVDAEDEYAVKDDGAVESLEKSVAYYRARLAKLQSERKDDPETPWNDCELPSHERVRFNKLNSERNGDGGANTRATVDNQSELVGYPTTDTP